MKCPVCGREIKIDDSKDVNATCMLCLRVWGVSILSGYWAGFEVTKTGKEVVGIDKANGADISVKVTMQYIDGKFYMTKFEEL